MHLLRHRLDSEHLTDSVPYNSLTTTFRHPSPEEIASKPEGYYDGDKFDLSDPPRDIYSRYTQPTLTRAERVLSSLIGQPTLVYPSGIAAFFAVLLHVRPDVVAISGGYHGCHTSLDVYRNLRGHDQVVRARIWNERRENSCSTV